MLDPAYWRAPTEANAVERTLPPRYGLTEREGATIGRLSGGAAFMRPLRVTTHRVEMTPIVPVDDVILEDAAQPESRRPTPAS